MASILFWIVEIFQVDFFLYFDFSSASHGWHFDARFGLWATSNRNVRQPPGPNHGTGRKRLGRGQQLKPCEC
jgi:hypothetical protein